jgi:hypothetical protein
VPVGVRIQRYCLARPELFGGKVFCRADQEEVRKNKLFADYVNGSLKNDDEYTPAKPESPSVEIIPELLSSFLDDCINPYEKTIETQGVLSVVQSLIDIMEKHGSVPSVVMDAGDDESLSLVSVRDNLVKISLKDHTYSVTRNMIALLKEEYRDYENLIPKAIIVSLAHDLGKIPELRESRLYNTSEHPLISASKLDELFVGMDDVFWRKDAVEVVREHHISTNNQFTNLLKAADRKAREMELIIFSSGYEIKPFKAWFDADEFLKMLEPDINTAKNGKNKHKGYNTTFKGFFISTISLQ